MNERREKTRPSGQPSDSMAPTVLAPTVPATTVHPTRPYGTVGPARPDPSPGRRTRLRPLAGALAAALGLTALTLLLLRPPPAAPPVAPEPVAVLEIVHGAVAALPASSGRDQPRLLALGGGEPIGAGTVIETGEEDGRAAIRLAGGPSVRFDAGTRARVASASTLELERGALYVDSADGRSGVEVRTTLGVVRDVGTQFEVRWIDEAADLRVPTLRVRVREGKVTLRRGGEVHGAEAGGELAMTADGMLTRGSAPLHGRHWDWVLATAPAPAIEGRSLRYFLDWLSREGGWTLRFAEPETAELASAIVLHGDVRGLTPRDAARVVLQGSGLGYRLEEGDLLVARADAVR